ncbi:hypothetical protein [Gimesia aquarii]|uniref:Uncharacterized protein n=1 Tax=Gimesia aquarii TaxID=2527964 RepID=A0A517X2F8_9PLAN|nr:hypothetical protein [Gimesia aquarii]QDU11678.1 hypothetical protein V202x_51020 [Gimesia aquarii]
MFFSSVIKLMKPTVFLLILTNAFGAIAEKPIAKFSVEVDLGKDVGQSFGTLFEVRNKKNQVIAGAGFLDVYNTRFRSDRHTLQFFVRPEHNARNFSVKRLSHPDLDCGIYLLDLDQKLQAWSSVRNNLVRLWNPETQTWSDAPIPQTGRVLPGDGIMRLGNGILTFTSGKVAFNDRVILTPPEKGRYYNFYYALGRLFFYHTDRSEKKGFTKIYACPWTSDSKEPIDLKQATVMDAKYVGATPFAWGQYRDEVLTVSNYGGVYVFSDSQWKTLAEAQKGVSFQVYSMLNYHDRLLMAQYPTGELFEYRGKELKRLKGWPPKLPGVSSSAREAQTMAIYRGDLIVGVWPWAEAWRYNLDEEKWHSMGRLFSHPELTDKTTHPYEAEAKKFELVANHWGQRVTGMVPLGNALMLSTSTKGTYQWFDKYKFLTDAQRREYGSVVELQMPGNLATQIKWKNRPIQLEFVVEKNRLIIRQDGKKFAQTEFKVNNLNFFHETSINWGQGVFGDLNGKLKSKKSTETAN